MDMESLLLSLIKEENFACFLKKDVSQNDVVYMF